MVRLERRPGQKEERYAQLLGGEVDVSAASATEHAAACSPATRSRSASPSLEAEVAALKAELGL